MTNNKWNEYQKNYIKNNYAQLTAHLDKDLVRRFKEKLKEEGITYADFIRDVINMYLGVDK